MRALWHSNQKSLDDYGAAERLARAAAERDPGWSFPHALIAFVKFERAMTGWSNGLMPGPPLPTPSRPPTRRWPSIQTHGLPTPWPGSGSCGRTCITSARSITSIERSRLTPRPAGPITSAVVSTALPAISRQPRSTRKRCSRSIRHTPTLRWCMPISACGRCWRGASTTRLRTSSGRSNGTQTMPAECSGSWPFWDCEGTGKPPPPRHRTAQQYERCIRRAYFDVSYPFRRDEHRNTFFKALARAELNL